MRRFIWLAVFAIILSTVAFAGPEVPVLDGTSWKVDVKPDTMTHDKGEKDFKATLTFADGKLTVSDPKVGSDPSPYSVERSGEKDFTFRSDRASAGEGSSVWTGLVRGKSIEGKLIWTKNDGAVFTYTVSGNKLD